jgi:putative flippase GtrA
VLAHAVNLGKGRALKAGFNYFSLNFDDCTGIVTADADGQHTASAIVKTAAALEQNPNDLILGSRNFSGRVPFRSRFGNLITKYIFLLLVGKKISDTQTGLRAIPRKIVPAMLTLSGEHYEYETNMLIETKRNNINIIEVPIETIYIEENKSSHFNPLRDSMKIYFLLLRFAFSSLLAAGIDFVIFSIVYMLYGEVLYSIIASRAVSGTINFIVNKNLVFNSRNSILPSAIKYWTTVLVFGFIAYESIDSLVIYWGINAIAAKIIIESILFLASFSLQRDFIFKRK